MVVRAESLRQRLLKLEAVTGHLAELAANTAADAADFRVAWAIERGLQLAAVAVAPLPW